MAKITDARADNLKEPAFHDHNISTELASGKVRYETRPVLDRAGKRLQNIYSIWITLDNPEQLNSYTTEMVKDVVTAFRRASNDRAAVSVVFTGAGSRAFCSGGNTREYAEYYAGRPGEYQQYMRLFNDMVTSILTCDLPVICRVNGLRVGGGQEIGMACDLSIASDLAIFGQAGPKHGSAPDGGATDFLPLFTGVEEAMVSCTLCDPWTAYQALRLKLIHRAVPVLHVDGAATPNPLVITNRWIDDRGNIVYGNPLEGAERDRAKQILQSGTVSLEPLDRAVEEMNTRFLYTFPGCLSKTVASIRKHKLFHWDRNRETNRAWLALNMMNEARAGFRAFHEGSGRDREVDFVKLRESLAAGGVWDSELIESIMPPRTEKRGAR
ncbi:MAG: 6-oxocyclohex-1-ene-1-carbonyl-CoA hydratase [Planctomycetes bacterium]|nr:6-oxocyclohex-1-ene-1-carbonyl-CoA hydratase [Planctomycetota bacterium]